MMPPCCLITCLSATRNVPRYPNRREFKRSLKSSTIPSFGLFINSGSVIVAEQLASSHESYDWLLIDAQHSPVDRTRLESLLTALAVHGCPSLVRVAGPEDRAGIQQALDLGAFGVMVPTVKTVEDAKAVVDSAFFPPLGHRSIAFPIKPQLTRDVSEFISAANDEVLVILQVETSECVDNLNEVCENALVMFLVFPLFSTHLYNVTSKSSKADSQRPRRGRNFCGAFRLDLLIRTVRQVWIPERSRL